MRDTPSVFARAVDLSAYAINILLKISPPACCVINLILKVRAGLPSNETVFGDIIIYLIFLIPNYILMYSLSNDRRFVDFVLNREGIGAKLAALAVYLLLAAVRFAPICYALIITEAYDLNSGLWLIPLIASSLYTIAFGFIL